MFSEDRAVLCTLNDFLPKVFSQFYLSQDILLPVMSGPMDSAVDMIRYFQVYLSWSVAFRSLKRLFVIPAGARRGEALVVPTTSCWIKTFIKAYRSSGHDPLVGLRTHST